MSDLWWEVLHGTSTTWVIAFLFTGIFLFYLRLLDRHRPGVMRWVFRWARRFFWVAVAVQFVSDVALHGPLNGWDALRLILDWWNYHSLKDEDDDDFWKRLRERATDVVKNLGHRLVVAPAGA